MWHILLAVGPDTSPCCPNHSMLNIIACKILIEGAFYCVLSLQGQQVRKEFPVHHSNVMHYSKEKEVRSRVGHKVNDAGKKVRYLVKTGEIID